MSNMDYLGKLCTCTLEFTVDREKFTAEFARISRESLVANGGSVELVEKLADNEAIAINNELVGRFLGC